MSEETLNYKDETEQKVLAFMNEKFEGDLMGDGQDFNLDMTLEECEFLTLASDDIKAKAKSGELAALTTWMKNYLDKKEVLLTKTYDQLDRIVQQADAMEQEILEDLAMEFEELSCLRSTAATSVFDLVSGVDEAGRSVENFLLVQGFADRNPKSDVQSKADTLKQLLAVRGAALRCRATIQSSLFAKGTETDLSEVDVIRCNNLASTYENAGAGCDVQGEAKTLMGQVEKTQAGDMGELVGLMNEHDGKAAELNDIYSNFVDESKSNMAVYDQENFRVEMMKYLAGNIFVKGSRYRYQKEQFDRFVASQHHSPLLKKNMTLRQFSTEYARMVDGLVEMSHNFRSPKIDANYDDFAQKTIMPVNATVFYYFFSSNRSGKTFAQWLLSTVRYPNERMRRAYIRFFA